MSGNGVDAGQIVLMLRSVIESQSEMGGELGHQGQRLDGLGREVAGLRKGVGDVRKEVGDFRREVVELRRDVAMYHATVTGHGIPITELDARLRQVEGHLNFTPMA